MRVAATGANIAAAIPSTMKIALLLLLSLSLLPQNIMRKNISLNIATRLTNPKTIILTLMS